MLTIRRTDERFSSFPGTRLRKPSELRVLDCPETGEESFGVSLQELVDFVARFDQPFPHELMKPNANEHTHVQRSFRAPHRRRYLESFMEIRTPKSASAFRGSLVCFL